MKKLIMFAVPYTTISAIMGYVVASEINLGTGIVIGVAPVIGLALWALTLRSEIGDQ